MIIVRRRDGRVHLFSILCVYCLSTTSCYVFKRSKKLNILVLKICCSVKYTLVCTKVCNSNIVHSVKNFFFWTPPSFTVNVIRYQKFHSLTKTMPISRLWPIPYLSTLFYYYEIKQNYTELEILGSSICSYLLD